MRGSTQGRHPEALWAMKQGRERISEHQSQDPGWNEELPHIHQEDDTPGWTDRWLKTEGDEKAKKVFWKTTRLAEKNISGAIHDQALITDPWMWESTSADRQTIQHLGAACKIQAGKYSQAECTGTSVPIPSRKHFQKWLRATGLRSFGTSSSKQTGSCWPTNQTWQRLMRSRCDIHPSYNVWQKEHRQNCSVKHCETVTFIVHNVK